MDVSVYYIRCNPYLKFQRSWLNSSWICLFFLLISNKSKLILIRDWLKKIVNLFDGVVNFLTFEIDNQKGYYYISYDEDDDDYEIKVNEYIKKCLTPSIEPIIIYDNNKFIKPTYETKYKYIVEQFMEHYGNGKKFNNITKIIKVEDRYER